MARSLALALCALAALAPAPVRARALPPGPRGDVAPTLVAPPGFGPTVPRAELLRRFVQDSTRAVACMNRGHLDSALAVSKPYEAAARARGDEALLARLVLFDAGLYVRQSRPEAMALALEGERHATAARDSGTLLFSLRIQAMSHNLGGDFDGAERLARRWLGIARLCGSREYLGFGHTMLGWIRMHRDSDYPGAARELAEGVRDFETVDVPIGLGYTLGEWANVQRALGDYRGAMALYRRALGVGESRHLPQLVAPTLGNMAALEVIAGDPGRAVPVYQRQLDYELVSGDAYNAVATMDNLIELDLRLGRLDDARALAERAVALARERALATELPWQLGYRASVLEKQGRFDAASAEYRAVAFDPAEVPVDARVLSVLGLARILEARDSLPEAIATLQRCAATLGNKLETDTATELELMRSRLLVATQRPAEALRVAEPLAVALERSGDRGRAFIAWTQVAGAQRALGAGVPAEDAIVRATALWEGDRRRVSDLEMREQRGEQAHALMTTGILSALETGPPATRRARAFERLQRFKTRTLLERMAGAAAFDSAGPGWLQAPVAELGRFQQDVLLPGEVLLEYAAGEDTTLLFVVTRDSCRVVGMPGLRRIGPALALGRDVLATRGDRPSDLAAAQAALDDMGGTLLAPVRGDLASATRVLIAADGPLQRLPFAAMTAPGARVPLGQALHVALVPSATLLRVMRERSSDGGARVLAVLGATHRGAERLRGAEREIRTLADGYADVVTWRGDDRHAAPLTPASLAGYRVVHFAGHAEANDQMPWRSGLHLGAAGAGADSLLAAVDIASSHIGSPVVVLSGCESAGGRTRSGEGVAGLSSAFLAAGARTVIATLWPVDDVASARLMERFYRELARGRSAGEALATAQGALRADPATAHPFHWAGYVLIGDDARTVALRSRIAPARLASIAILATLVLVLGALALFRRRPARGRDAA